MPWTLVFDESGRFEGRAGLERSEERVALLVGGILAPGTPEDVHQVFRQPLLDACNAMGVSWPPHGNELRVWENREALYRVLWEGARTLGKGTTWFFLVDRGDAAQSDVERLLRYARMVGELTDLALRYLVSQEARSLHVVAASRSAPVAPELRHEVERRGAGALESGRYAGAPDAWVRAWTEAEVRNAHDALGREEVGYLPRRPVLGRVRTEVATMKSSHGGLYAADLACNYLYRCLGADPQASLRELLPAFGDASVIVLDRLAAPGLRAFDRALRETPAALVRAGQERARLTGRAAASQRRHGFAAGQEGARLVADRIWDRALVLLADARELRPEPQARALAGTADALLAMKSGDYEGTWVALDAAWAGQHPLAARLREGCGDRELAARLWRLTLECANHRGDVSRGRAAVTRFEAVRDQGLSLALLAEDLLVQNLRSVLEQNRFLVPAEEAPALAEELRQLAEALEQRADEAAEVLELAAGHLPAPQGAPTPDGERELALWQALGHAQPAWQPPDRERGRCYGTAARTHAFLGDLDRARTRLTRARSFFGDSGFDLYFNAAVLARVELERARLERAGPEDAPLLRAALASAGVYDLPTPKQLGKEALDRNPGLRFGVDLLLRAALWAPGALDGKTLTDWTQKLERTDDSSLLSALRGLRSHPTELVARHAAEVLHRRGGREEVRLAWLDLALELAREAELEGRQTLATFGDFSRRLREDPGYACEGSPGALLNPTFEYR